VIGASLTAAPPLRQRSVGCMQSTTTGRANVHNR
jgi:hypothetical protein